MATVKLTASAYTLSNSNYMTVTNPSYMYDNTSDTSNYATIRGRAGRSSNNTYYCYLHGFNFGAIPSNATVSSFTVKIKGYRNSYQSTGSSYRVRLCGSATNSAISGTTCSSDWGTSATTLTIPTGSLTWSQIVNYGSGFSIQLRLRNSSTSSSYYPYLYIYGAEIEVTYTVPSTNYTISATTNETDIIVSRYPQNGTVSSGHDAYVSIEGNLNDLHVTDNNVDVTSSLVYNDWGGNSNISEVWDEYIYNLTNVQENHTIVVSHSSVQTLYTVTASTSEQSLTILDTAGSNFNHQVGAGRGWVVMIGGSDFTDLYVEDNGTDVTSSLVYVPEQTSGNETYPAYYYYYVSNVSANHTVTVQLGAPTPSTYTVSGTTSVQYTGLTAYYTSGGTTTSRSLPVNADAGTDVTVRIWPSVDGVDLTGITVTDNGVDVTSSIECVQGTHTNYCQYTISNIQAAHTIVVTQVQVTTYSITASTSVSGVTLTLYDDYGNASGTSMSVTAGDGGALVVAASDYSGIHLTDNGVDVTSSLLLYNNNTKRYSFSNVQAAHTLVVTRATTYSVTASTSVSGWQVAVFDNNNPNQTTQIEAGDTAYVMILGGDYTGLRVTDNGVDVTSSLQYDDSGNTPIYYYQITNVQGAHVIVVSKTVSPVRVKQNGSWITAQKVLVKQNGSWVIGTVKVKDGGTWK